MAEVIENPILNSPYREPTRQCDVVVDEVHQVSGATVGATAVVAAGAGTLGEVHSGTLS